MNLSPMSARANDAIFANQKQYGGPGYTSPKLVNGRNQRQRMNVVAMAWGLFVPWGLYVWTYWVMSFFLHYEYPWLCYLIVWATFLIPLFAGAAAGRQIMKRYWRPNDVHWREPTWVVFLFLSLLASWIVAMILGDLNYWTNMQPYYDLTHLSQHKAVDPAQMRGQQMMDAGAVFFDENSHLDLKKSMGFRNLDLYCVAPITKDDAQLSSYDFWAVGLNCCSGNAADFACGEYSNPDAHAGLRLMRDEQRSFFRLAVQQAENAHNIKAEHPLFFYWMQDPIREMESYRDDGFKFFYIGMLAHFGFQVFCVILAAVAFSKMNKEGSGED